MHTELYAYLAFLLILLTFGLETGYFRFATNAGESKSKVYSNSFYFLLFTGLIFVLLLFLFTKPIIVTLGADYHSYYIYFLVLVIFFDSASALPFAKLRLMDRPIVFSLFKIGSVAINLFFNVVFLYIIPKYFPQWQYVLFSERYYVGYVFLANLIGSGVTFIGLLVFMGVPKFDFDGKLIKRLLAYSLPLLIAGLGGTTNESFDRIFLKYLLPSNVDALYELGIYGSNVKLAVLMVLFIQMYRFAAEPFFFSYSKQADSKQMYAKLLKYFVIFCLLIFLGVSLNLHLFKFLVGAQFRVGLSIVPILLMANLLYGVYFNISVWYKLTNKTHYGIIYTFTGAVITIAINFALIPIIGAYGAALARLVCYFVMTLACLYGAYKYYGIPYELRTIGLYFFVAIAIFLVIFFIPVTSFVLQTVFGLIGIILFLIFVIYNEKLFNQLLSLVHGSKNHQ
ncbi:MAG: polysaccharide biosynthesis protein [Bacteroidales bacterium]|nr:polysaccharide biosynthesis protein [Bacteroidales bacterium]MBN2750049.1 polysaccharide biosynthesis protein [Bacteroidales bacterium]